MPEPVKSLKLRLFSVLTALFLATSVSGRLVAQSETGTLPPLPAPGRLIDVGGWRMHINCTGTATPGRPSVILEAGIGDFSVEWSLVQPSVSSFARVCSYDRSYNGWSDMGPQPRTMRQIVYELHALLERAGEKPPFVLVGHSYGGWLVRHYRLTYPQEVVGMVLVEGGAEDPRRMLSDGVLRHASDLVTSTPIPAIRTSGPLSASAIPDAARNAMLDAIAQYASRANEPPRNKLPGDAQRMRLWDNAQLAHWAQNNNPHEANELALLRDERKTSEFPFGDTPLIVLTRGLSEEGGPDGAAQLAEHRADHTAVAKLSRNGRLIVAEKSGHHVQIDEPQLVVTAIRNVLAGVRRSP